MSNDVAGASPNLNQLFNPSSLVFVGASDRSRWSRTAYENLRAIGFQGTLHLVNRRGGTVHAQTAAVSCRDIGAPVDTALLMIPVEGVMESLKDVASAGIRCAVVVASGFAELGADGSRLQDALTAEARALGITLLGPNCMGFLNFAGRAGCWTGSMRTPPLPGRIGVVSQSGAVANYVAHFAHQQGIGRSCLVSTGNEACLDLAGVADFLVDDPATNVVAIFAEAVRDPAAFTTVAGRAMRAAKPLVILKVGRSEVAARAARSHTGALVGDDKAFDGACRQLGVIRVDSVEELVITADLLAKVGALGGNGVGIVSISGGMSELAADRAHSENVRLPELSETTTRELKAVLPSYGTPSNPLDITGAAVMNTDLFQKTLKIFSKDPSLSLLACLFDVPTGHNNDWADLYLESVASISRALASTGIPSVLISHTVKPVSDKSRSLIAADLPYVAAGLEFGIRAIRNAVNWSGRVRRSRVPTAHPSPPPTGTSAFPLSEREALVHLSDFGVPVIPSVLARTEQQSVEAAAKFGDSVALKIASPDIAHKSDIGGVALDVAGADAVALAFRTIRGNVLRLRPDAKVEGILVSPMRRGGIELFVGVKRDPQWGHVIAVGLGGVWIEALKDISLRVLPVEQDEVVDMLAELRGARLLRGYRGSPSVDLNVLAGIIVRIGDAASALGAALETFEVNPLFAAGSHIEALDALAVRRESPK